MSGSPRSVAPNTQTLSEFARQQALLALVPDAFAWEVDAAGRFTYVDPRGGLGFTATALTGALVEGLAETPAEARRAFLSAESADGGATDMQVRLHRADGDMALVRVVAAPVAAGDGQGAAVRRGWCRDISAETTTARALTRARHREDLLTALLRIGRMEAGPKAMLDTAAEHVLPALDAEGAAVYHYDGTAFALIATAGSMPPESTIEPALVRIGAGETAVVTGESDADVLVQATRHEGTVNGALALWHRGGSRGWQADDRRLIVELAAQVARANVQIGREDTLRQLSETDTLTGLANRRAFLDRLCAHLDSADTTGAVLFLDLDNFKPVNDSQGHAAGDRILRTLAEILCEQTRARDVPARLGGDEFAVLLAGITPTTARRRAAALAARVGETLAADSVDAARPLGVSIGIAALAAESTESADEVVARADQAMYAAKTAGKGGVHLDDGKAGAARGKAGAGGDGTAA